jgi:Uma2 family endonuclease
MSQAPAQLRPFDPGTTGWSVDDLSDPEIQRLWSKGRHELVDGVLTMMAPQHFHGIRPLSRLRRLLERHLDATRGGGFFHNEIDLVLKPRRVARPDMLFLTPELDRRQRERDEAVGATDVVYGPIRVPPLLIVESTSVGHEDHDRETKRGWYAEAGVPNYWLLDATARSLECLALAGAAYETDVAGRGSDVLQPRLFPGLEIPLAFLWSDAE